MLSTFRNQLIPPQPAEVQATLRHLQQDTIVLVLPAFFVAGMILLTVASLIPDPLSAGLPALLLFLLPLLIWQLLSRHYSTAAWLLVGGALAINLLIALWGQMPTTLYLLWLPVGIAALFLGFTSGLGVALVCMLLLLYLQRIEPSIEPALCAVAAIGISGVLGLVWLTLHPLLTAISWFRSSYEQNCRALEEARDRQEQLGRLVDDLADANLQLTRLNRVAGAMRQAAEDARHAKEQFVANVSHELRTPLNMIIGFSEMITQAPNIYGGHLPPALLADFEVILRNSRHLSQLIDDVLDLSQMEAGQMAITKERVQFSELVHAAIVAVRPLFQSKGLELQSEIPPDLPPIYCDRTRIRQVLLNLLSNAGRFTERGGVTIKVKQEAASLVVSVADTGPGIEASALAHLFQPFQQLDDSLSRRVGGNGLGLSISKRFVELHDGQMWVSSEVGVGTTFYFSLPIVPDAWPGPLAEVTPLNPEWEFRQRLRPFAAPPPVVRPRFVVLEEEDNLQRMLRRYWDQVEVEAVTTLEDARAALQAAPAQALLVNDPTGTHHFEQLRTLAELPYGTPLLLCAIPSIHQVIDTLGAADYLMKPITRENLFAALERLQIKDRTVLVVDDEPDALQLYRRMLTSTPQPYRVLRADNGEDALAILSTQRPDAMLLDLVMPKLDGFQLLAAKNRDPMLREIPAIIMTASNPAGQLIVSSALTITQPGGLSVSQLLACMAKISEILAPWNHSGDPNGTKVPAA